MNRVARYSDFIDCDLQDIVRYLSQRDPRVGSALLDALKESVAFLTNNPEAGRGSLKHLPSDWRSWHIHGFKRYLILYRLEGNDLVVGRVIQGSRDLRGLGNR